MASPGPTDAPGPSATIQLAFKNPSRPLNDTFELECALNTTIGQLKSMLQSQYPGNPAPEAITLIYAGKVLRDEASPLSAFLSADLSPVAIHIVVKAAAPGPSASSAASAVPSSSTPAPASAPTPPRAPVREQPEAPPVAPSSAAPSAAPAPPPPAAPAPPQGGTPMSTPPPQARPPAPVPAPPASASPAMSFAPTPSPNSMASIVAAQQGYTAAYHAAYQAALNAMMTAGGASPDGAAAAPSPGTTMAAVMLPQPLFSVGFPSPMGAATPQQQQQGDGTTPPPAAPVFQPAPAYHMPLPLPLQTMPYPVAVQPQAQYYYAAPPQPQGHEQQQGGGDPMQLRHRRRGRALTHDEVIRVARMLRQQGVALPPELAAALERHEGAAAAGGRRGGPAAAPRPRAGRVFQLRLQINVRALLQMAVLMVVVYQHCPPRRFAMLCVLGLVLWLSTTPRVRAFLQAVTGFRPMAPGAAAAPAQAVAPEAAWAGAEQQQERAEGEGPAAADVARPAVAAGEPAGPEPAAAPAAPLDAAAAPAAVPQEPGQQAPRGLLAEIHAFVAGFITSLLPAMDHNHDPAAVAAAAEEMRDVFAGQ